MAQVLSQDEVDALLNAVNNDYDFDDYDEFDDGYINENSWESMGKRSPASISKENLKMILLKTISELEELKYNQRTIRSKFGFTNADYLKITSEEELSERQLKSLVKKVLKMNLALKETRKSNIMTYDLTNQDRVIRGRMPVLEHIYENMIRKISKELSNKIGAMATVSIISTDLLKFGELMNTLPIPSLLCTYSNRNELNRDIFAIVESKLAYAFIDSSFGGTDRPFTKIEGKEFTDIELSVMGDFFNTIKNSLQAAWRDSGILKGSFKKESVETNPQLLDVCQVSDVIIVTTFEVEFESASGTIMIVVPYGAISHIKKQLSGNEPATKTKRFIKGSPDMKLKFNESFDLGEYTVGDLRNIKKEDFLELKTNILNRKEDL
jgi:flagellar motor switch protein FliM